MKQMKLFLSFLLLLSVSFSLAQTGVVVTYYDNSTQGFNVSTSGKLYFSNDNLNIKADGSATPTSIPVSIIRKVTFSNTLSTTTFGENDNHMVLFPNPSSDIIRISADTIENLEVNIYAMTGQLVQKGSYTVNQDIDISGIPPGLYLVQANNITFKFVKK
ncbi:MAG: T9SS type A sorting domain-containing protein [Bacteroidetes bacterium]|nr:T9SS type A sorting domain-containing protein [Bacteroidota bacterium]